MDAESVEVILDGAPSSVIQASNFLIATGSSPRKHREIAADGQYVLTSDHMHHLKKLPKSIVIIGAGVIGCEYVQQPYTISLLH